MGGQETGRGPGGLEDLLEIQSRAEICKGEPEDHFKGLNEANLVLKKIAGAWDNRYCPNMVKLYDPDSVY